MSFSTFLTLFCIITITITLGSPLTENFDTRIVGGEDAVVADSKFQAAILVDNNKAICSGALIGKEWVVTVAHCVYGLVNFDTSKVALGTLQLSQSGLVKNIKSVVIHPNYNHLTLSNNIALIELDTPVTFTDDIQAILYYNKEIEAGETVTVTGWGTTSATTDGYNNNLQKLQTRTISWSFCKSYFGKYFPLPTESTCCQLAGVKNNPCWNDAGAPLTIKPLSLPRLVGLLSFVTSMGCDSNYPTVFTTIYPYQDWINSIISPPA